MLAFSSKATHHCHTVWSDGKNSVEEMVEKAISLGFEEIGIADHICFHPTLPPERVCWSMKKTDIGAYVKEVRRVALKYKGQIVVKVGAEVDYFAEFPEGVAVTLEPFGFDYLVGSVHMVGEFATDGRPDDWKKMSQQEINDHYLRYWKKVKQMVMSRRFHIVGHIDLPKKFGFYPSADFLPVIEDEIESVLSEIKKSQMIVEINSSGLKLLCQEAYPSNKIIERCHSLGIPMMVNDDAHSISDLGQFFDLVKVPK